MQCTERARGAARATAVTKKAALEGVLLGSRANLELQHHRVRLALGADAVRPRRVRRAAGPNAAAHVLQAHELASARTQVASATP